MIALAVLFAVLLAQLDPTPTATLTDPAGVVARWEANTYSVQTGQPFTLTLRVELAPGLSLVPWEPFPPQWGEFEVQTVDPVNETPRPDGGLTVTQSLHVLLWRPQDVVTPEWFITYTTGGGADIRRVPSREAFISVPTVLDFNDKTLRPPRPPLSELVVPWGWIALGGATLGAVALRRRRVQSAAPAQSPALVALSLLQRDISLTPEARLRQALNFSASESLLSLDERTQLEARLFNGQSLSHAEVDPVFARLRTLLEARGDA